VQRRVRVAPASHRHQLAGLDTRCGVARGGHGRLIEGWDFEDAERSVPNQGLRLVDGGYQALQGLGSGVENALDVI
jgi:hypothetical protein